MRLGDGAWFEARVFHGLQSGCYAHLDFAAHHLETFSERLQVNLFCCFIIEITDLSADAARRCHPFFQLDAAQTTTTG
jgi:hypothetical protein